MTDVVQRQFADFQKVRDAFLKDRIDVAKRRIALANRTRSNRLPEIGEQVMHNDPKLAKSRVGHGPGVRGLAGPYVIEEVNGAKVSMKHLETGVSSRWGAR